MLINILVQTIGCTVNLILYLFFPSKQEKTPLNLGYLGRMAEIFRPVGRPKTSLNQILFHKNSLPRDLYAMTLSEEQRTEK